MLRSKLGQAVITSAILAIMIAIWYVSEAVDETKESDEVLKLVEAKIDDAYGGADAIVTVCSDDGYFETAANLNQIFGERELRCTIAAPVWNVNTRIDDWKNLLAQGNVELVSHSMNHIPMGADCEFADDMERLEYEIVGADTFYEDNFGSEQIVFVCPENEMCENGFKVLYDNDFWAVRGGERGFNNLSPAEGTNVGDWFNLRVRGVQDKIPVTQKNNWVNTAIHQKKWLIEMWHNVLPEDDGNYQTITVADACLHLDYIRSKSDDNLIWVATFDEAVKYIREKQNCKVKAYIKDDYLIVEATLDNEKMKFDVFNQPLSIIVKLPDKYKVEENLNIIGLDKNIAHINVLPGRTTKIKLSFGK